MFFGVFVRNQLKVLAQSFPESCANSGELCGYMCRVQCPLATESSKRKIADNGDTYKIADNGDVYLPNR